MKKGKRPTTRERIGGKKLRPLLDSDFKRVIDLHSGASMGGGGREMIRRKFASFFCKEDGRMW